MSISVQCPECGKRYRVDDSFAGQAARCKACGAVIPIPEQAPAAEPAAPEPAPAPDERQAPGSLPKTMMANRVVAGCICPVCNLAVDLGQHVRNCELCGTTHHEACWQSHGGCSTASCGNAPLPRISSAPRAAGPPGGLPHGPPPLPASTGIRMKACPYCGEQIPAQAFRCKHCDAYLQTASYGGRGAMPPQRCGNATAALVLGIVSLVICGVILGPVAIVLGSKAKRQIAQSRGRLTGAGSASAGIALGVLGLVLHVLIFVVPFALRHH